METEHIVIFDGSAPATSKEKPDNVLVSVANKEKMLFQQVVPFTSNDTQQLLESFTAMMADRGLKKENLKGVAVIHGSERFTVSRLVTVIANGLSWSLHIPAQAYDEMPELQQIWTDLEEKEYDGTLIDPHYAKEPTINMKTK
ncbi:hypothetical protein ACFL2M_00765 [Patescibacteria group bacterium]